MSWRGESSKTENLPDDGRETESGCCYLMDLSRIERQ